MRKNFGDEECNVYLYYFPDQPLWRGGQEGQNVVFCSGSVFLVPDFLDAQTATCDLATFVKKGKKTKYWL